MDNDFQIIKALKSTIKSVKFNWDYRDISVMSEETGNDFILHTLESDKPFMVARGGAVEMNCVGSFLSQREYSKQEREQALYAAGIFPNQKNLLDDFCKCYIDTIQQADLISLWGVGAESQVVHAHCQSAHFTKLRALEPYYFSEPWSKSLANKKVLIIHPFIETIQKQLTRRTLLWGNKSLLPEFKAISYIKAVQSNAGAKSGFSDWFAALDYMKAEIDKEDFDVAIKVEGGSYW